MAEKSAEFLDEGARVYLPIDELAQAVPSTGPSTPEPSRGATSKGGGLQIDVRPGDQPRRAKHEHHGRVGLSSSV